MLGATADSLAAAVHHHESGRLAEAEQLYRQILEADPDQPDALHMLGLLEHSRGNHAAAAELIAAAIRSRPGNATYQLNHGVALQAQGKLDEAIASYEWGIAIDPNLLQAHLNLGLAYELHDEPAKAGMSYRRALAIEPGCAAAYLGLGTALVAQGQQEEAQTNLERAVVLDPGCAAAYFALGNIRKRDGQQASAADMFRQAVTCRPEYAEAYVNLAESLRELRHFDDALASCREALHLQPELVPALITEGNLLQDLGHLREAEASFRRALSLDRDSIPARYNLGNVLRHQARIEEAVACYRQVLDIDPTYVSAHSNLLFSLHCSDRFPPDEVYAEYQRFDRQHAVPLAPSQPHTNNRKLNRRLRIGYVSPDFRRHAVAYAIEPVLAAHERRRFETICYSDVVNPDEVTERLRGLGHGWRDVRRLTDSELADLIRQDGIDILVDLAGHTGGNRLLVFARKPAPVQVTYLGYPATTGLSALDYFITDAIADPPGQTEAFYSERLIRLPGGFVVLQPPADSPPINELPFDRTGVLSFGSLTNPNKLTPEVLATWVSILEAVPGSRLVLKNIFPTKEPNSGPLWELCQASCLPLDRLLVLPSTASQIDHLAGYNNVDIGLDTFPYNGGATTYEALWMGVPVVTLAGRTHPSRVAASVLCRLGFAHLVADRLPAYVNIALELAGDLSRVRDLRRGMRQRILESPLSDGTGLTRQLEAAYRQMWAAWCERG